MSYTDPALLIFICPVVIMLGLMFYDVFTGNG
jgi:hypothetical protein